MSQTSTTTTEPLPVYTQAEETKHELEWADLVTLDLSLFDEQGGRQRLADKLFHAIQNIGFFYITNFDLTQTQIDRQFAIGREFFSLPLQEKLKYRADLEKGGYNGYKPMGLREIAPGVKDNNEIYNIPKFVPPYHPSPRGHPAVIEQHLPEIESFSCNVFEGIVKKLLVLFAMVLELPENHFLGIHRYAERSDDHLRYMKYRALSPQENEARRGVWVKGHTDYGSLTLLFRQPIASLQVLTPSGQWRYVKPLANSITVNLADTLDFLSNGFLRSSIHRVVAPPEDQAGVDRYGVLYFARAEDDTELKPVDSPVLKRLGYDRVKDENAVGVKAGDWVRERVKGNVKMGQNGVVLGKATVRYYD